jgi:hypothetical protein
MVPEQVELQQAPVDEALLEDEEVDSIEVQEIFAPEADTEAEQTPEENDSPVSTRSGRSIDAIRAGIMGVINSDNLKPVDPNSYQGRL